MVATIKQFVGLHAQMNEIIKRLGNGSLDPTAVKRALQDIIEGKLPAPTWNPPRWWRTPEQQMARARQLWPDIELPEPPMSFVPHTKTEVLLLHVPRPFDELWDLVEVPQGYTKWHWKELWPDRERLRLAPNLPDRSDPVWLGFDYAANRCVRPNSLWGRSDLAASEVLSAVIQFPEWSLTWFKEDSAPSLAGFHLDWEDCASPHVPSLLRSDAGRQLCMGSIWAGYDGDAWRSPVVREL